MSYDLLNIINYGGAIDNLREFVGEYDMFDHFVKVFRMLKKKHVSANMRSFIKKVINYFTRRLEEDVQY